MKTVSQQFLLASSLIMGMMFSCTKEPEVVQPKENVWYAARQSDPRSLDPQFQFDGASSEIVKQVYDSLLEYHYLKRPYQMEANLLTEMPKVSEDGKTVSFELKKGVLFVDDKCFKNGKGRELVTDDVFYTIKRFADLNINTNSWFMLQGLIEGLDEFREKTKILGLGKVDHLNEPVAGLHKIDDYHFELKLKQKSPLLLYAFATSATSIVPHEAVEYYKENFRNNPVGTGPFRIESAFIKQETITLVKNPNYHKFYPSEGEPGDAEKGLLADAGKRLPLVDKVVSYYIAEKQPEVLRFKKGELSSVLVDRANFKNMIVKNDKGEFELKDEYAKKYSIFAEPELSAQFIVFNLKDDVFKNKKLRQAIAYALDIQGQIDMLSNGAALTMGTPVPHGIAGSEMQIGKHFPTYNLEKAKQLLAEAGYPNGEGLKPITMTFRSTTAGTKNSYEYYRYNLAQVGIKLIPEFLTFSRYLKVVDDSAFQISESGWSADYPDGENFYQLLYGPNKAPGPNIANFDNPTYNKLYEEIRTMENGPERFAKFVEMSKLLGDEVPFIFRDVAIRVGMKQKWVRNFKKNMMEDPHWEYLAIEPAK